MMYENYDFSDSMAQIRRFPSSHLSAPITKYPQCLIINNYKTNTESKFFNVTEGVIRLKEVQRKHKTFNLTDDSSFVYSSLLSSCYENLQTTPASNNMRVVLKNLMVSVLSEVTETYSTMARNNPGLKDMAFSIGQDDLEQIMRRIIAPYYSFRKLVEIRNGIQKKHIAEDRRLSGPITIAGMTFYYAGEVVYCVYGVTTLVCCVMNYDQLIMLTDTVSSRFLVLLTVLLNDARNYDVLPSYKLLTDVYRWGDQMIRTKGMNAYSVIGEYESFVTAMFVRFKDTDKLNLGLEYHESQIEAAIENEVLKLALCI